MNFVVRRIVAVVFAAGFLAGAATAQQAPPLSLKLSPEWSRAVEPLKQLPVQDGGFVRTAYTLSGNYISAISGRTGFGKADAFEVVMQMLRDTNKAQDLPLIKLSFPELVHMYEASRISASQWRDESKRDELMALIKSDQDVWLDRLNQIEYRASLVEDIEQEFAIIPREGTWLTPLEASRSGGLDALDRQILDAWTEFRAALAFNDAEAGGAAARELLHAVDTAAKERGVDTGHMEMDYFYHKHHPFRNSSVFYLFAALCYGVALLLAKPKLNWVGFGLLAAGFVEQVIGVSVRWMLAGRAPLSNMYESFTFAVGGMVLIALILEAMRVTRLVGLGAAILGFAFMVIAHKAPIFNSEIRPLMPALQSSWLTYHVVTIMLSYSAFALSFFVSLLYLGKTYLLGGDEGKSLLAKRTPSLRALDIFNYRIISVGFPLLSLGIIFGAVWAATAWGRPWGWDPKETWSAITWLIYAIYLHVRYLAGWSGKRAAILAFIGFLAVLFTYLGVNYLLPGLHSYV